ncbi:hypothetical protein J7L18_04330 [Candidatus Bathyarchaeota archaeon]|nr:hypothetical protein [Candidatus Bathyarchaeota archaeon]
MKDLSPSLLSPRVTAPYSVDVVGLSMNIRYPRPMPRREAERKVCRYPCSG